ncbi:MAG: DUF2959 domain-containing protein [Acidobacteria bacterium]|nr:DUF2959 domain-containing protein [Acidobacteriota bacterium]
MKRSLFLLALGGASCTRLFYKASATIGREKRDILTSRVKDARKDQEEAKEQFQTTLEAFQAVTGFQGGKLEDVYSKLSKEFDRCEDRAKDVSDRIESIEKVAKDMFREWSKEIDEIGDRSLRTQSRTLLRDTQTRYDALAGKLKESERRMTPVLRAFRDQVLFLKHNLNARAIQSLKDTSVKIDADVTALIRDMDASIREADAFVATLAKQES